jgi:hypothetical protein
MSGIFSVFGLVRMVAVRTPSTGSKCSPRSRTVASPMCSSKVCDALLGLSEAIHAVWDQAIVQTCIIHLLRNTFKYASRVNYGSIVHWFRRVKSVKSRQFVDTSVSLVRRHFCLTHVNKLLWSGTCRHCTVSGHRGYVAEHA